MLKRDRQQMPDFVKKAILDNGVEDEYDSRPEYQQNDYLMWINNAKQMATKEKRLAQMLDELKRGGVYMKMEHPASRKEGT